MTELATSAHALVAACGDPTAKRPHLYLGLVLTARISAQLAYRLSSGRSLPYWIDEHTAREIDACRGDETLLALLPTVARRMRNELAHLFKALDFAREIHSLGTATRGAAWRAAAALERCAHAAGGAPGQRLLDATDPWTGTLERRAGHTPVPPRLAEAVVDALCARREAHLGAAPRYAIDPECGTGTLLEAFKRRVLEAPHLARPARALHTHGQSAEPLALVIAQIRSLLRGAGVRRSGHWRDRDVFARHHYDYVVADLRTAPPALRLHALAKANSARPGADAGRIVLIERTAPRAGTLCPHTLTTVESIRTLARERCAIVTYRGPRAA